MTNSPAFWRNLATRHIGQTPFFAYLKGEVLEIHAKGARTRIPYSPELVGDPDSGVIHGGVITALLDHTSGAAVMAVLREPMPIATLDLRIDYMKPATPGAAIEADVHCIKVTREVAFVRGAAYHADPGDPIAICTGTFMLTRPAPFSPAGV